MAPIGESLLVPPPEHWPADYFASRARFVELARACGARMESRAVDAVGPRGEPLSVDVGKLGPRRADHLIVLVSGVHGAEGFLGAAVQHRALRLLARTGLPDGVRVAMIHAANPWGFAHLRRVDEHNVDVNRNFVGPTLPEPLSPSGYAELNSLINPRRTPGPTDGIAYWARAARLIVRDRGTARLAKSIAEGQYEFPQGLFYGGAQAGESCRTLQELVLGLASDAHRLTVLDVHSGLGPSATPTLIGDGNVGTRASRPRLLREHYGLNVLLDSSDENAYDARGTFARWCREALADKRFLYLCVEIGTVNPVRLFSALRRENQAHHWSDRDSAPYHETKRALLEVFAPRSPRWRRESVAQGLGVLERTLELPERLDASGDGGRHEIGGRRRRNRGVEGSSVRSRA